MATPDEAKEKAVKILLENHRLVLTLVGFLIAGLFAYAGRGANYLDWRYFIAGSCFIAAGVAVIIAVSVAINQACEDKYDPHSGWMTIPYGGALLLIAIGLVFTASFMNWPPSAVGRISTPNTGILIVGSRIEVAADSKLKVKTLHNPTNGNVQTIEITP